MLPENVAKDLKAYIGRRKMSAFICNAIEEKLNKKKEEFAKDLVLASADTRREKESDSWDTLIEDGFNDENQY